MSLRRCGLALALVLAVALLSVGRTDAREAPAPRVTDPPVMRISGSTFVDAAGEPMRLFPIHFGTSESTCVQPHYNEDDDGVFSIPRTSDAFEAIRSWHANAIRIPMNEQCWLGVNPVQRFGQPNYHIEPLSGDAAVEAGRAERKLYRSTIRDVVQDAHAAGLAVIFDLHWSAAGKAVAFHQWPLPDEQYSVPFWRSVARAYRDDPSVAFEIFNEPFLRKTVYGDDLVLKWGCLLHGCTIRNACSDCGVRDDNLPNIKGCGARCPTEDRPLGTYRTAGTQELVDAIRDVGATQPILVPGRDYTNDLSQWARYAPDDPLDQLAAVFHNYEGLPCDTATCWDALSSGVGGVPIVTTEFGGDNGGETDPCPGVVAFDETYMDWADAHDVSYGGFGWGRDWYDFPAGTCAYVLLAEYPGTPRYGQGQAIYDHFTAVAP